jgi:hypothetical protein
MVWTKMSLKTTLIFALAGGFMLFGVATHAHADDRDSCSRNVQNWQQKLDRDIDRHGFRSRQANNDRHELDEARETCQRRFGGHWQEHHDYDRR